MIAKRPWKYDRHLTDRGSNDGYVCGFIDGNGLFNECDMLETDEIQHIVACVNAFHDAGIDPADLPKFVDGARAWKRWRSAWMPNPISDHVVAMDAAAACLPENK